MKKVIAAVVAVLVIGSSAIGQINLQYQTWSLGVGNNINLGGGVADASTIQGIGTLSMQDLVSATSTTASQGIGAALFQSGSAETTGAPISLVQTLTVAGVGLTAPVATLPGQQQSVGLQSNPAQQFQGVVVAGDQVLQKQNGSTASAEGTNLIAFGMGQGAANLCVDGRQLSVILGGQHSDLNGECFSTGSVITSMDATVIQLQQANN